MKDKLHTRTCMVQDDPIWSFAKASCLHLLRLRFYFGEIRMVRLVWHTLTVDLAKPSKPCGIAAAGHMTLALRMSQGA